jgi:hypothetical protein
MGDLLPQQDHPWALSDEVFQDNRVRISEPTTLNETQYCSSNFAGRELRRTAHQRGDDGSERETRL